ncbi:NADP-dependent oxidoreductase [Kribbella sp. CA-253562]|uniref:NADP-dependent oxidoreductase n=1 Tax=Kribbella sp. CA-253562 TaxID=3239942 RepID=UPI003D8B78A5
MKAIVYRRFGGPEVLEAAELPRPKLDLDGVLVQVKAAAVNPADLSYRQGMMDHAVETFFPVVPGWDLAGVVVEAGPAAPEYKPGDEVIGYLRGHALHSGAYAELVAADVQMLAPKPHNLSWAEAAGLPLAGLTAYQAVVRALAVRSGETVLIHAAAGGVGSLATQIALARGARVIGTASPGNHAYLTSLGATPVRYGDGLAQRVRELVPAGVDAVLDAAGRGVLATTPEVGKKTVRVASVVDPTTYPGTIGVFARLIPTDLAAITALAEAGDLTVRVGRSYPLHQAAQAHRNVASAHSNGKVVLVPS